MADVFRIEIPVEVTNKTDMGELQQLESLLGKIHSAMQRNSSAARGTFDAISSGAGQAGDALEQVAASAEEAAQGYQQAGSAAQKSGQTQESANEKAEQSSDKLGDTVEDVSESYEDVGESAQQAGNKSGSAFTQATGHVDKFSQRIEKTNQSLRKMFAQKFQMTLAAIDKISPTLRSVTTSVKNLTSKAWRVTVKIADMVTAPFRKLKQMIMSPIMMTLSLTGIGMGAGSFVSTFTDFVSGMSNVKALSGATEEEFSRLTETAEQLGATTKFTASEAAEGMQYLAMAGWKTNDIIAAMPGLLDLAAAGGTSLGTAADIVSDVMTAMGMASDQASRAADIFARTATGTNTTIENLGETLKYAAPIAHSFGLELSEVSTITGMMANAGVKGSMAGTAIRSSLLSMASPSKEAAEAMKKLNLQFADGSGKMKSMQAIVRDLSTAFKGLSEQEKLQYAEDIFGKYGSSAWLGVIEQGADAYDKLFESIDKSNGAAKEMANTQLDNLQGDVVKLQSAVDGMKISVMNQLDPYLRKGVQWLTGKIPDLTAKFTSFITTGIGKAKELKNFLQDVFNSSDFQNAEGFAGKFFVAWDKIIAEPFSNWWEGNGRQTVLGAVEKVGSGMGEMYHGIISGIFAALKGEEIDFEGLNLTGLGKAGAEAAKTFIESFKDSFDLGGLFDEAPGLLKAGLLGFGALKIGGGALGIVKTIGSIRMAFGKIPAAAAAATAATDAVGASTATAAAGAGKLASVLGLVKTGLSAIPVWGWVAAAALAAVTVGIIAYSNAQKEHERELLNTGEAAAQMAQDYKESVDRIAEATDSLETIKKIEIQIEENRGGNQQVIEEFKKEVGEIQNREVWIIAKLAQNTLTPEEIAAYQAELEQVKGQIADVEAKLSSKTITAEQAAAYQAELEQVKGSKAEVEAALAESTLTAEQVTAYQAELENLKGQKAKVTAALASGTLTADQVTAYQSQLEALEGQEAEINAKLSSGTLTAQQVLDYQAKLDFLTGKEAELKAALASGTLTASDVSAYQAKLETLKGKKAELEAALASGTLTKSDVKAYQEELDILQGKTVELVASLNAEGYDAATVAMITEQYNGITAGQKKITLILANKTQLTPTQIQEYVDKLTALMGVKTEKELYVYGSGLKPDEITDYKTRLEEIKSKTAKLKIKMDKGPGSMSTTEWNSLVKEYNDLTTEAKAIEIILTGAEANSTEIQKAKEQIAEVDGAAKGILLNLAYAPDSELTQSDLNAIAETLEGIADQTWIGKVGLENAGMSDEEMQALIDKQNELYRNMVETTGGVFTKRDVEQGRISQEDYAWWIQDQAIKADLERQAFNNQVISDRDNVGELVQKREAAQAAKAQAEQQYSSMTEDQKFLIGLERERQQAILDYQGGKITYDALLEKGSQLVSQAQQYDFAEDTGVRFDLMGSDTLFYNLGGQLDATSEYTPLMSALKNLGYYKEGEGQDIDAINAEIASYDKALNRQYKNEATMATRNETAGLGYESGLTALSIDELASQYGTLDSAAQDAFLNAVAGIQKLNEQATYVSDQQKINVQAVVQAAQESVKNAAAADVIGDITASLTELNAQYSQMDISIAPAEQVAQDLASVNEALAALNLDQITDISQIGDAIEKIKGLKDVGTIDFSKLADAFSSIGKSTEEIEAVKNKLEEAKQQADNLAAAYDIIINSDTAETAKQRLADARSEATSLAGTYTVYINYVKRGDVPDKPAENALGGIYDGAFLSWVAEDGPEAIIPLGADKRGRGLDLWMQAGEMLGVSEFADGGIMAPYSGLLDDIPDDIWEDDEPKKPKPAPQSGNQGGGNTVHVSVSASPVFQIDGGGSPDEVISVIMDNVPMLAEVFGAAIADKMEDIVTNLQ